MLIDIITLFLLAAIPAAFSYFLDYCLGHPMAEDINHINTKEILFKYSFFLAKLALPEKKQREIVAGLSPLLNDDDPEVRRHGKHQLKISIIVAGRDYFFIEKAFGMCQFCTNFWIAQIVALVCFFTVPMFNVNPILFFLIIPIFSHAILRKL